MTTIILTGRAGKSVLLNELKKIYSDDEIVFNCYGSFDKTLENVNRIINQILEMQL